VTSDRKPDFIHFQDIYFNRHHLQVVSGVSIDPANPEGPPFVRIILRDGVEWRVPGKNEVELLKLRQELIKQL
jgi:hypothetical protein